MLIAPVSVLQPTWWAASTWPGKEAMMRPQIGVMTLSCVTTLAAGSMACSGQGSKPVYDNEAGSPGLSRPTITLSGCIEQLATGHYALRRASADADAVRSPTTSRVTSDGDANSGHMITESSRNNMAREGGSSVAGSSTEGTSSAANGPWAGTGTYRLTVDTGSGSPTDLSTVVGALVSVTGRVVQPQGVRAAGTDQMQAAEGAVPMELTVSAVTPLGKSCNAAEPGRH
jgi:hypothetical protein